ncbi:hypothetical protein A5663_21490 [Mycobacterium sp. E740]|nr:hypothetical protein A5663_21490 [Mycobacterium sp. E740]
MWGRYNDGTSLYILDDIIEEWPDAATAKDQVAQARRNVHLDANAHIPTGASNTPQSVSAGEGGFLAMGTTWPGPATLKGLERSVKSNWVSLLTFSIGRFTVAMAFWTLPPGPNGCPAPNPEDVIAAGNDQATYIPK